MKFDLEKEPDYIRKMIEDYGGIKMSCICAKATDQWHGWECSITGGACMYLCPNQDQCADDYGEVEHTKAWKKEHEED